MNRLQREQFVKAWLSYREHTRDGNAYVLIDENTKIVRPMTPLERKVANGHQPTYSEVKKNG